LERELSLIHKHTTGDQAKFGLFRTAYNPYADHEISAVKVVSLLKDTKAALETILKRVTNGWRSSTEEQAQINENISIIDALSDFWSNLVTRPQAQQIVSSEAKKPLADKIRSTPLIVCCKENGTERRLIINPEFKVEAKECLARYATDPSSDLRSCDNALAMADPRVLALSLTSQEYTAQFNIKYPKYSDGIANPNWQEKAIEALLEQAA
jgi:hypothetical protein